MILNILDTYEDISREAKNIIAEQLSQNANLLLCAASGGSPTRTYEMLAEEYRTRTALFSRIRIIKLDEWGGIPMTHPGACEYYLQQYVIKPLAVTDDRYIAFKSNPDEPERECERIQHTLAGQGPIDICVLGIGMNGHIAFNEPAPFLRPGCHVAALSNKSMQHPMIAVEAAKPSYGLTLGMADILQSKKIILLVNGAAKREIMQGLLSGKVTTDLPASFLWLHPDVVCLASKDAIGI